IGVRLTDADQPFIGMDAHHQIILRGTARFRAIIRHQENEALDIGDLHGAALSSSARGVETDGGSERQTARASSSANVRWQRMRLPFPASSQGGATRSQIS